jgi:hypothetical protein
VDMRVDESGEFDHIQIFSCNLHFVSVILATLKGTMSVRKVYIKKESR